jgi:hAT family C-terminal dimerisation region
LLTKHGQQQRLATQNSSITDEFPRYFARAQAYDYASQEVAHFWKNNKDDLPILHQLAKILFAIQPMSAQAERNFSTSNSLITQKRASLNPERVHKILFLHDNLNCLLESLNKNIE